MSVFVRTLRAELIKFKRTLAFWAVLLAPTLVAAIFTAMALNLDGAPMKDATAWQWYSYAAGSMWALFFYPMLIALVTALLAGSEHASHGWRKMYAMPVGRYTIYFSKLLTVTLLMAGSNLLLSAQLYASGKIVNLFKPEFGFADPVTPDQIFLPFVYFFLASGVILSFHQWLANRFDNFSLAIGIGIGGTFVGMVTATGRWQHFFPWKLMINTRSTIEGWPESSLLIGVVGGIVLTLIGAWDMSRHEVR